VVTVATDVTVRLDGGVAMLRLDGAERMNAISSHTYRALAAAVTAAENNGQTRAVVIHGAGRAFSAGADIEEMAGFGSAQEFRQFIHGFTDALAILERSRLPIVAAINGLALGGGLELAMACDLRVAASGAKLGLPEAKLGVLPGAGGTQRLPRLIPRGVATEMLMLGRTIDGVRAHQLGLVNQIAASGDAALTEAVALAGELAAGPVLVPARTKALLRETAEAELGEGIVREREVATELFATPDGQEGFAAFRERRAPAFAAGQPS
jgi:enoyl-CoA hydratase/carnithine racemase